MTNKNLTDYNVKLHFFTFEQMILFLKLWQIVAVVPLWIIIEEYVLCLITTPVRVHIPPDNKFIDLPE